MRHLALAAVVAALLATMAQAGGPGPSLTVTAPTKLIPAGHAVQVEVEGTNPERQRRLWVSVGRHCERPLVAELEVDEDFSVPIELMRRKPGTHRVCASLALAEDDPAALAAETSFRIGPPELRSLLLVLRANRGRTARRPGVTVFHVRAAPHAKAHLSVPQVRHAALGADGRAALRVPWSCARPGPHRYRLAVRDRYGNHRARAGRFRSRSCVGLRGFFVWPLRGRITSPFGYAERGRLHDGIDIDDNRSSRIRAAAWGRVSSVGSADGYGLTVVIDHGSGFRTFYAHESSIRVHRGQRVRRGQVIGRVGCTGYCTGSHLHFGMHVRGRPVNPLRFL
jgi:hypothetical protein